MTVHSATVWNYEGAEQRGLRGACWKLQPLQDRSSHRNKIYTLGNPPTLWPIEGMLQCTCVSFPHHSLLGSSRPWACISPRWFTHPPPHVLGIYLFCRSPSESSWKQPSDTKAVCHHLRLEHHFGTGCNELPLFQNDAHFWDDVMQLPSCIGRLRGETAGSPFWMWSPDKYNSRKNTNEY